MAHNDIQFNLQMAGCGGIVGPPDVLPLALALPRHGFLPADGKAPKLNASEDVPTLVASHSRIKRPGSTGTWWVVFPVLPQWTTYLISSFSCRDSKEGIVACHLGSLIERKDSAQVEPFAQRLLLLAFDLYPLVKPAIGWIDESYANETLSALVKRTKLVSVSWVNFFGPPYVQKYGKDLLMGVPGYRTEKLPDGGVFHQLTPNFLMDNQKQAKGLRRQVIEYFKQAGLKVTCRAPYYFPGIERSVQQVPADERTTDNELREHMREILAMTLVLQDGTRVKPIFVPWETLTTYQQMIAVEFIRQAAVEEIMSRRGKRIRFEFNEVPYELERVLTELVGTANPDFEFVQVNTSDRSDGE